MSTLLETITHRGLTIEIHVDIDAESPRTAYENGTRMVLQHGRYDLPFEVDDEAKKLSLAELEAWVREHYDVVGLLPVWGYDHGQLAMAAGARHGLFADPWDSGCLGLIFMDREGQEAMGTPDEYVEQLLRDDVETYNAWALGGCRGWIVNVPDGTTESCWGYYGDDEAIDEAKAVADSIADHLADEAATEAAVAALPVALNV